mmetsp:Transcript_20113/g.44712  ORF Transcript_20113/g.44712 Transcript_20113/m.44712 type:complete len:216 (-) Transcript_20113:413-1060(-)|eukprot:CAMPEP_0173194816 /NCGR_PEP_ID=MMETSP1141-20130122/14714_1 /TAXON_ID=483371 /ORGANISM="non described non described, Strain CCMP2298" /LENGTH=215 /DNA_ID=CAMNT_0014119285 /DNA_START=125 /DNA_END=772 /DNA_ORIENTATION=+
MAPRSPHSGGGRLCLCLVLYDPRVSRHVRQFHTSRLVLHQQAADEVPSSGRDGGGEPEVDIGDAAVGGAVPLSLEGGAAHQELVREHAQGPHVRRVVVLPSLHHLWGQVVQSAAQGGAAGGGRMHGPAEVGDLYVPALADQQVLGLDIAMDHVLVVAVVQSDGEVVDVPRCERFAKVAAVGELFVELSAGRELQDNVNTGLIPEEAKHTQDVLLP